MYCRSAEIGRGVSGRKAWSTRQGRARRSSRAWSISTICRPCRSRCVPAGSSTIATPRRARRPSSSTSTSRASSGPIVMPSGSRSPRTAARRSSASSPTSATDRSRRRAATRCISTTGRAATGREWRWWSAARAARHRSSPMCVRRSPRTDPSLPTGEFYPLEQLIDNAVGARRLTTQLLGFFSALALTLAAIGLYGVIAQSVVQRTQEIGIRMAIGAQRQDVLGMILASGLRLVSIGVALGLVGAFALTRVLQTLLFGITAHDPTYVCGERFAAHLRGNRGLPVPCAAGYEGQSHHRPARGVAASDHRRRCLPPAEIATVARRE